jgi:hypothetical protein
MNEQWYFAAREGDQGPFGTAREARQEMQRFAREKHDLEHFQHDREAAARSANIPLLSLDRRVSVHARVRDRATRELMI